MARIKSTIKYNFVKSTSADDNNLSLQFRIRKLNLKPEFFKLLARIKLTIKYNLVKSKAGIAINRDKLISPVDWSEKVGVNVSRSHGPEKPRSLDIK